MAGREREVVKLFLQAERVSKLRNCNMAARQPEGHTHDPWSHNVGKQVKLYSLLSYYCVKRHDPKQLTEGRICFGLWFWGESPSWWGRQSNRSQKQEAKQSRLTQLHMKSRGCSGVGRLGCNLEAGQSCKFSKLIPETCFLYPACTS